MSNSSEGITPNPPNPGSGPVSSDAALPVGMTSGTLFGHPSGLFTLFFAEMWERFSYYGMRALLVFYMIKGFLSYGDGNAYAVYGAYTALVYMTPFFGGMLADRLLGARRAVVLGGILMAAGHLLMTLEDSFSFFSALALLIAGNGFFKPNISTIVGSLYPEGSTRRDGGFTIFYMGINLGAAMSPLLCGYIGETYGWHYGFGLATIGMITGVAIFVAPSILSQLAMFAVALVAMFNIFFLPSLLQAEPSTIVYCNVGVLLLLLLAGVVAFAELGKKTHKETTISTVLAGLILLSGALAAAVGLFVFRPDNIFSLIVNFFVGIALLAAAGVAMYALFLGGLPSDAGAAPSEEKLKQPVFGFLRAEWAVYLGTLILIPVFALLVSGFAPFTADKEPISLFSISESSGFPKFLTVFLEEISKPAGIILFLSGVLALGYLGYETFRLDRIPRERMFVVLILTFFSMLFWAFFEQAGSSMNNFTDRNVDRVFDSKTLKKEDIDKYKKENEPIRFRIQVKTDKESLNKLPLLSQEQLGHTFANDDLKELIAKAVRSEETRKKIPADNDLTEKKIKELKQDVEDLVKDVTKKNVLTMTALTNLRDALKTSQEEAEKKKADGKVKTSGDEAEEFPQEVEWMVTDENVGMALANGENPASVFQALNPIYILIFGIVFTALWSFLGRYNLEPNTTIKFALGLLQLGLGFGAIWIGAQTADERGMAALSWLFVGYLLHTTGELCLSPVGLAMVTKMSPKFLVSTVMGMWFLATAFSQFLAAILAQFTNVGEEGGTGAIPVPSETINVYGDVFGTIAIMAMISAVICFALSPLLSMWMHEDVRTDRSAIPDPEVGATGLPISPEDQDKIKSKDDDEKLRGE